MSSSHPRILGLILARGGSKRLPGKNLTSLCGKPMVTWSVQASLACSAISSTVVSTDCPKIAETARAAGARVPFMRPNELAQDLSSSADAALHALQMLAKQGEDYDAVCLVEPTSPMRTRQDLPAAVQLLKHHWDAVDAVVTLGRVQLERPGLLKRLDDKARIRPWNEQEQLARDPTPAWFPYGVAYVIKTETLAAYRTFYPPRIMGLPIARWQQFEVDDPVDLLCVEAVMQKHLHLIA